MSLTHDFAELAARFRRIHSDNGSDGQRQLVAAAAWGGKLVKRADEAGLISMAAGMSKPVDPAAGVPRMVWPSAPVAPFDNSEEWAAVWGVCVIKLSIEIPDDLPPNVGAVRWTKDADQDGIQVWRGDTIHGAAAAIDWRQRSENYALVADVLAAKSASIEQPAPAPAAPATAAELIGLVAPDGAQVLLIAQDHEKSAEYRMRHIVALDQQYAGWSSERWATLLDCKPQAIHKTSFWKDHLRATK